MSANSAPAETHTNTNLGILYGGIAAVIWGAWPVVTAIGVKADFAPFELVFLRLAIAAPLLLPWAFRGDNSLKAWAQAGVLALLAGGSYSYITASGFQYTTATHGGVIIPGAVMLVGLIASHFLLNDRFTRNRLIGAGTITVGLLLLAFGSDGQNAGQNSLFGDGLFFFAGTMWAAYTLLLRKWPADPLVVTARISLLSLVGYIAVYPFTPGIDFSDVPTGMLLMQAAWQGVLSAVVAIVFFNKGVAILGAARAGVVNAIVPVVAMALAFLILSEVPTMLEQLGLVLIMTGIGIIMFLKQKVSPMHSPAVQKA